MNNSGTASISTLWPTTTDYATTTRGIAELAPNPVRASGINPYPISHVLAATAVSNDYLLPSTPENAGTDWVITFPMRKHGIYSNVVYNPVTGFDSPQSSDVTMSTAGFYDSEEQPTAPDDAGFSPVLVALDLLPREINILSFGKQGTGVVSDVLRSAFKKPVGLQANEGWGRINFNASNSTTDATVLPITAGFITGGVTTPATPIPAFRGVPTIGFAALRGDYKTGPNNVVGESVPHVFDRVR
jgi:hypothetical protein